MRSFFQRPPDISLDTPQAVSIARALGFDQPQVDKFFELLGNIIQECNISSEEIYNIDESSVTVEQRVGKVLAKKNVSIKLVPSQVRKMVIVGTLNSIISCAIAVEDVILLPKRVHKQISARKRTSTRTTDLTGTPLKEIVKTSIEI